MNRLYRLLAFGYLPKELPPIFNSKAFASSIYTKRNLETLADRRWQRPCHYLLQQRPHYKRKLDILAPHAMVKQAILIADNYPRILKYYTNKDGNCSLPAFNRRTKYQRAVRPYAIGLGYTKKKLELRARFPLVVKLDIKNYYRSVYTHSIPWAIYGKSYAKAHLRNDNYGNNLDKAFQQGQDGQTVGIPTGPDTSFIISELLMCRIIRDLIKKKAIKPDRFVRYYDDIEYGCEREDEAYRVLSSFEDVLREYELETNPEKVKILTGPKMLDSPWAFRLRALEWDNDIQSETLVQIFSAVDDIASNYPNEQVYKYFLKKMRTCVVGASSWEVYQNILLSILQENRGDSKEVFEQFIYYRYLGYPIKKRTIKEVLDRKVSHQISCGVTSELTWALYGYMLFEIKISKELATKVFEKGDVPSRTLIAKIADINRMSFKTIITDCVNDWDSDVLNSSEWLLAYEIFVNQWCRRGVGVPLPANRRLYELLEGEEVSFLDDSAIGQINIPEAFRRERARINNNEIEPENITNFIEGDDVEGDTDENSEDEILDY